MRGTTATGSGREPSAARSWIPRTLAAFFLGAGVYAGLALVTDLAAHADETAATTTQAEQAPPAEAPSTGTTSTDPAAARADQPPAAEGASTTSSSPGTAPTSTTTMTTSSTSTTTTDAGQSSATATAATASREPTRTETHTVTTSTTATADGTKTLTTTTTKDGGTVTVTTREETSPADAPAQPKDSSTPTVVASPAGAAGAVVSTTPANLCRPVDSVGDAGSAPVRHASTTRSTTPAVQDSASVEGEIGTSAVSPDTITAVPGETDGNAPPAPEAPMQLPAPASAFVLGGCGGPGAGHGSPKGASAPGAAVVLGSPLQIPLPVNDVAPTAPAAGSPTTTATDPGTRPD